MRCGFTKLSVMTACLLSFSQVSQADFELDLGFASEYVRSGLKQSSAKPVLQVGGLYASQLGFYGGAWLSGVERGDGDSTRFEIDGYGGFYYPITPLFALDVGAMRATFWGDADGSKQSYNEGFFNFLIDDAVTLGYRLADDYLGTGSDLQTLELAYTLNSGSFGFEFSGRQYRFLEISDDVNWGNKSRDDYFHFRVGVARTYDVHNLSVGLERTNLSGDFDGGTQLLFTYSRNFKF